MVGKLIGGGQAQIVMGAKGFVCSLMSCGHFRFQASLEITVSVSAIAGRSPSFHDSRSKVIVVCVMGVCSWVTGCRYPRNVAR